MRPSGLINQRILGRATGKKANAYCVGVISPWLPHPVEGRQGDATLTTHQHQYDRLLRHKKNLSFFLCCLSFTVLLATVNLPKSVAQTMPAASIVRPILRVGNRGVAVSELQAALKLLGYYKGSVNGIYGESTVNAVTRFQRAAGLTTDGIVGPSTWERLFPQTQTSSVPTNATPARSDSNAASTAPESARPVSSAVTPSSVTASRISAASFPVPSTASQPTPNNTDTIAQQPLAGDLPILKQGTRGAAVFWLQKRLQSTGFFQGTVDGIFGSDTELAVKAAQRSFGLNPDGVVGNATWRVLLP